MRVVTPNPYKGEIEEDGHKEDYILDVQPIYIFWFEEFKSFPMVFYFILLTPLVKLFKYKFFGDFVPTKNILEVEFVAVWLRKRDILLLLY